ncbi:MAG: hypothetical protein ACTSQE_06720 [Candidatus Heimdallarchaeaceae archaeon]
MSNIKSKDTYKKYKAKKKGIERKALKLWKQIVLERFPLCISCKKEKATHPHHYFYKSSFGHLIYYVPNGIGLCPKCHFVLHHQDPKKITRNIKKNMPKKWLKDLENQAFNKRPQGTYKTLSWLEKQYNILRKQQ